MWGCSGVLPLGVMSRDAACVSVDIEVFLLFFLKKVWTRRACTCVFMHVNRHLLARLWEQLSRHPLEKCKVIGPFSNEIAEGESEPGAEGELQDLPEWNLGLMKR